MSKRLSPQMEIMVAEIRAGGGRASVSYHGGFHVSTRRGWGSNHSNTWEALVARGVVAKTDDWDNIGRWWELIENG